MIADASSGSRTVGAGSSIVRAGGDDGWGAGGGMVSGRVSTSERRPIVGGSTSGSGADFAARIEVCIARAFGHRPSGSKTSARSTISATRVSTSRITVRSERAGSVAALIKSSAPVSHGWTYSPVRRVNIVAPSDQMSARPSIDSHFARACSGAMNAGVPIWAPLRVGCTSLDISRRRAMPKSSTFTSPPGPMKTFSGFMSRWTMPFSCAATRTSSTRSAIVRTSPAGSRFLARIQRIRSVSPSSSSSTR